MCFANACKIVLHIVVYTFIRQCFVYEGSAKGIATERDAARPSGAQRMLYLRCRTVMRSACQHFSSRSTSDFTSDPMRASAALPFDRRARQSTKSVSSSESLCIVSNGARLAATLTRISVVVEELWRTRRL